MLLTSEKNHEAAEYVGYLPHDSGSLNLGISVLIPGCHSSDTLAGGWSSPQGHWEGEGNQRPYIRKTMHSTLNL